MTGEELWGVYIERKTPSLGGVTKMSFGVGFFPGGSLVSMPKFTRYEYYRYDLRMVCGRRTRGGGVCGVFSGLVFEIPDRGGGWILAFLSCF